MSIKRRFLYALAVVGLVVPVASLGANDAEATPGPGKLNYCVWRFNSTYGWGWDIAAGVQKWQDSPYLNFELRNSAGQCDSKPYRWVYVEAAYYGNTGWCGLEETHWADSNGNVAYYRIKLNKTCKLWNAQKRHFASHELGHVGGLPHNTRGGVMDICWECSFVERPDWYELSTARGTPNSQPW